MGWMMYLSRIKGIPEQTDGGKQGADRGDLACTEAVDELVGEQAGDNRENTKIGGHEACYRDGEAELRRHHGPGGAEQGVGDTEAHEAGIYDNEQKGCHRNTSK